MLELPELYNHTARWFLSESEPAQAEMDHQIAAQQDQLDATRQAIEEFWFTPSPPEHIRRALELAELQPTDSILDAGAGDGRLALMALREFQVRRAYAIEANALIVRWTRPLFAAEPNLTYAEGLFQTATLASDITAAFFLAWHCSQQTVADLRKRLECETTCRILVANSGKPFDFAISYFKR